MSQPFKLFRLQQLDSQLDQGRNRLREIETALNDNAALNKAKQSAAKAEAELSSAHKVLQRAEEAVQAQNIKIEQTETTLYGGTVRNPKELQDLQNESAALRRYLDTLEERQLEALIAAEERDEEYNKAVVNLSKITAETEKLNLQLISEKENLLKEINRLEGERQAAATGIPQADLNLYERLRQQRRGVAVAKVNINVCSACGSSLNAALLQAARSPNQLSRCESCGRILYSG